MAPKKRSAKQLAAELTEAVARVLWGSDQTFHIRTHLMVIYFPEFLIHPMLLSIIFCFHLLRIFASFVFLQQEDTKQRKREQAILYERKRSGARVSVKKSFLADQEEKIEMCRVDVNRLTMSAEDVDIIHSGESTLQAELPAEFWEKTRMHREELWTRVALHSSLVKVDAAVQTVNRFQRRLLLLHSVDAVVQTEK